MTILRQGRWLRSVLSGRAASSLTTAAVVGAGLFLLPTAGAFSPHSRAKHPLPTPLHTTAVADTGSHTARKGRKEAGKGKPGTRSTSTGSAPTRRGSKRGKGRKPQAEPAESPIPMYRARRGSAPLEHGPRASARLAHAGRHPGFAYGPAPLVSSYRHNGRHNVQLAARGAEPLSHAAHLTPTPARPRPADRDLHPAAVAPSSRPVPVVAANRPEVYAEGTSHPDDDERLPRDRAVMGEDAPPSAPAPIVRVSAAPSPATPVTQPQVVQGFGGEIAIPSSGAADRPGGTHRRNHPSNWQPESMVAPPEPLEEREAITDAAVSPAVLPEIDRNGRLLMPAPLRGSHDVLVHQNVMATTDGLERIYDDADLERLRAAHMLVSFPVSESLRVNEDLPYNRRVARPWTVMFASDMGRAFYARFRQPLQVNSAARTVHYQARLQMVNGNAAAVSGDAASPHLTGQAIDLAKRGMTQAQLAWMRAALLPLMRSGRIDVEEEFQQACFHVSVYRSYAAGRRTVRDYAQVHPIPAESVGSRSPDDQ